MVLCAISNNTHTVHVYGIHVVNERDLPNSNINVCRERIVACIEHIIFLGEESVNLQIFVHLVYTDRVI